MTTADGDPPFQPAQQGTHDREYTLGVYTQQVPGQHLNRPGGLPASWQGRWMANLHMHSASTWLVA